MSMKLEQKLCCFCFVVLVIELGREEMAGWNESNNLTRIIIAISNIASTDSSTSIYSVLVNKVELKVTIEC